jgi:hypothetical protein
MVTDPVRSLLVKEQEELNTWTRTVTQIYFTWYGVFLALSGAALTWAFGSGPKSDSRSVKYGMMMFALWSLLGFVVAVPVLIYVSRSDMRVRQIYKLLLDDVPEPPELRSPIPAYVAKIAYSGTMIALASLFVIWLLLLLQG